MTARLVSEIDRARRYDRQLAIVKLRAADVAGSVEASLAAGLRACDTMFRVNCDLYLVLPETGRGGATSLVARVCEPPDSQRFGEEPAPVVAVFPDDAVTVAGLMSVCGGSEAGRRGRDNPASPRRRVFEGMKRTIDLFITILAMPVVLVLIGMCALAVVVESGRPVFFHQYRTGKDGRRFRMLKLRTMVPDAENRKTALLELNDRNGPDFKVIHDPRVTRVGRLLRKSSLDELPQFFHVVTGKMTLVGPRPTSFAPETYLLWHTERLEVRPGLTGVWQVNGRDLVDFDERVRLELSYLRSRSAWTDVRLLVKTVPVVLNGSGT